MGFSTGEVIWWEPISQRYTRLNKNVSLYAYASPGGSRSDEGADKT